ncbi:unnamed protein product [Cuscuta campestris]|uniref:RNase H type-1 domain-containing protein n=1 Tax=Cuscuta campestris TaxID=132261 RepID=A0A484MPJ7_9ASTE|nr:unnamed protein product [Cuscuta campestris]
MFHLLEPVKEEVQIFDRSSGLFLEGRPKSSVKGCSVDQKVDRVGGVGREESKGVWTVATKISGESLEIFEQRNPSKRGQPVHDPCPFCWTEGHVPTKHDPVHERPGQSTGHPRLWPGHGHVSAEWGDVIPPRHVSIRSSRRWDDAPSNSNGSVAIPDAGTTTITFPALAVESVDDEWDIPRAHKKKKGKTIRPATSRLGNKEEDEEKFLLFFQTLRNRATEWFNKLRLESIDSFSDLASKFKAKFQENCTKRKKFMYLSTAGQRESENLTQFLTRWKEEVDKVEEMDDKTVLSLLSNGLRAGELYKEFCQKPPATDTVETEGSIVLPVELRLGDKTVWKRMRFIVVDIKCVHNTILGRPGINKVRAMISMPHLCMKFHTPGGVGEVRGDQRNACECYARAVKKMTKGVNVFSQEITKGETREKLEPEAETVEIKLHPGDPSRTVKIGANLPEDLKAEITRVLQEYAGIFAWSVADMPGIDRSIICHRLAGQALTDFLVEMTGLTPDLPVNKPTEQWWEMAVDGASGPKGCGGGIVFTTPEGFKIYHALIFNFKLTNNEAEYEALAGGLRLAQDLKINRVSIKSDSSLIVGQVTGNMEAREGRMAQYKDLVLAL